MNTGNYEFGLKAQARRLRTALEEQGLPVTHVVALNLIARAQGSRNWEALQSALPKEASVSDDAGTSAVVAPVKPDSPYKKAFNERWLACLEAALRMQGLSEEDLDELVHDIEAPEAASRINNDGMLAQLATVLAYHGKANAFSRDRDPRADLVTALQLTLSDGNLDAKLGFMQMRHKAVIPMRVNVCAGQSFEQEEHFDALQWFVAHSDDDVSELVADGLHNSSWSDDVALWLQSSGQSSEDRQRMRELTAFMDAVIERHLDVAGLTVEIDQAAVKRFVEFMVQTGQRYSDTALAKLDLTAD